MIKSDASLCRHIIILAGEASWQEDTLQEILLGHEEESLWIREETAGKIPCIPFNKAKIWLGTEKRIVIFDANKDFDADSFAAITGIVVGGGLFFLLLPEEDTWNEIYSSYFGQRLLQSIHDNSEITLIKQNESNVEFVPTVKRTNTSEDCTPFFITSDQKKAVEVIEKNILENKKIPLVLMSDRGRGKSAALGIIAARLVLSGIKKIAITAPRMRATDIVFKHIADLLPDAIISRGKVVFNESTIQFYSPDQLTHEDINADLLFIDEAAAIPVPLLTSLLNKYPQCVFATTVHGYEGTGRGFSLRFFKVLDKFNLNWLKLQMQTPIRWAENDPLENWMFDLLCLDAEIVGEDVISKVDYSELEYCVINKETLIENSALLKEVFSLLVLAHYRTRPKDLKNLLDDESIFLYVALYNNHAIAVSLVIQEGSFSGSLSTEVYRGERRPQGHLLAQSLTYHCGVEHAATLNYARVMRIAVHPSIQQKGIGTELLNFIIKSEKKKGRDAIGTSFGMNKPLLDFWLKSNFEVVRIGFTREQTSGEHAAIMLLALSNKGKNVSEEAIERFKEQSTYWFDDVLDDIPENIKKYLKGNIVEHSSNFYKKDIISFIKYSRNYELCIAAVNIFVELRNNIIMEDDYPEDFRNIIVKKVTDKKSWKVISKEMDLVGKKEARNLFYNAIVYLEKGEPVAE